MNTFGLLIDSFEKGYSNISAENLPKPSGDAFSPSDYAIWRFLKSWGRSQVIGPDEAVLFRQIVRWTKDASVIFPSVPEELKRFSAEISVDFKPSGHLLAKRFEPAWAIEDGFDTKHPIDAPPQKRRFNEALPAEPYLRLQKYSNWQSQAQKEATWLMLNAAPGSSTLVALPTGSGKSLCFQTVARFSSGLTVVVVPTVALAIDQYRSATESLDTVPGLNPRYFAADDPHMNPDEVAKSIKDGQCRLVFTSPEACVSGRLRFIIEEMSRNGTLSNFVIDEAHIIETWGIYFRVDFQLLASLLDKWRALTGNTLRTYLLSATFTSSTKDVLQKLFGRGTVWTDFVSQMLRPEMIYSSHIFHSEEERNEKLLECIWKLPRPAILYTTEVKAAVRYYELFKELGFNRLGCFTGDTLGADRRKLLTKWRNDEIDLMVGTSAFGLGVDKSDVRTVIHACVPENLHRYYQEVGRGGRDGYSSIAVLLGTQKDTEVAKGMAPTILTEEKSQKRWESMWASSEKVENEDYVYFLNTATQHSGLLGTRTFKENISWNKRLLLQLVRAGKLEVLDMESRKPTKDSLEYEEWFKVRLHFSPDLGDVGKSLSTIREEELRAAYNGFNQIKFYLDLSKPICWLLKKTYGPGVERVCGGCKFCRKEGLPYFYAGYLSFNSRGSIPSGQEIVAGFPDFRVQKNRAKAIDQIRKLVQLDGMRRFLVRSDQFEAVLELFQDSFAAQQLELYRVDRLDKEPPARFLDEPVCVLHVGRFEEVARRVCTTNRVTHFLCGVFSITDQSGRFIGEMDGWTKFESLSSWRLRESK